MDDLEMGTHSIWMTKDVSNIKCGIYYSFPHFSMNAFQIIGSLQKCDSLWFHQSCSCVEAEGQVMLEKVYPRLTYCCYCDMTLKLRVSSNFLSVLAITLDD